MIVFGAPHRDSKQIRQTMFGRQEKEQKQLLQEKERQEKFRLVKKLREILGEYKNSFSS